MNRLLLIDDDEGNRVTLSALLEDEGFVTDVVASFAEAKRLLETGDKQYVAVLLDHSLGDGYGTDLIPVIRKLQPNAKVVAMSGSVGADRMRRTADADLPKGLHFLDFLSRLQALLCNAP
ncbi:MAG: response regulator [Polyangiaceae bacterium]